VPGTARGPDGARTLVADRDDDIDRPRKEDSEMRLADGRWDLD